MRAKVREQLDPELLAEFGVRGGEADFEEAVGRRAPRGAIVSIKSSASAARAAAGVEGDGAADDHATDSKASKKSKGSSQNTQLYKRTNKQSGGSTSKRRKK